MRFITIEVAPAQLQGRLRQPGQGLAFGLLVTLIRLDVLGQVLSQELAYAQFAACRQLTGMVKRLCVERKRDVLFHSEAQKSTMTYRARILRESQIQGSGQGNAGNGETGSGSIIHYGWRPNLPDEADNHLIELAMAGGAAAIITHNARGIRCGELLLNGLRVLTPVEYPEETR